MILQSKRVKKNKFLIPGSSFVVHITMRSLFKISVATEGPLEDGGDADHCGDEVGQEDFV